MDKSLARQTKKKDTEAQIPKSGMKQRWSLPTPQTSKGSKGNTLNISTHINLMFVDNKFDVMLILGW